jgi:DNA polymerase (family X)
MKAASNQEIARIFAEIGEYLQMQNVQFKPRAYARVAETISSMTEGLADIYKRGGVKQLKQIPGVGEAIAEKIIELLETGRLRYYEKLKKSKPVNLSELTAVDGIGPKRIAVLYQKLGIRTLKDLEAAAKKGKIETLEGFGKQSQDKILKSIEFVKTSSDRKILGFMLPSIKLLEERIAKRPEVDQVTICGSARRRRDTIGDIDIMATSSKPLPLIEFFVTMPEVGHVYAKGPSKALVRFRNGMDVDLRVVPKESYGAAILYFTGSKDHNILIRELALQKGMTLNEYGLYRIAKGKSRITNGRPKGKMIAGKSEEEIYAALGMQYIPPEIRENTGEIALAREGKVPSLIEYGALKGDLQVQTNWADGAQSIEQMAAAAMAAGLEYIAVTDHTYNLKIAGGLDPKRVLKQIAEIDVLNAQYKKEGVNFRILKGSECDILKDGSLDLPDEILSQLDIVGASVHSFFKLPRPEQTARIIKAMSNPNVDIVFHPTGRRMPRREPYDVDIDAIIAAAKKTNTVLEIDSFPDRSDLNAENIRKCVTAGVKMSIDSDAHHSRHFAFLEYGISQARRGWATKTDIINAWPVEKMLSMLK